MTFYHWLQNQVERNDVVGDFAYTVSRVDDEPRSTKRKENPHKMWATWLVKHNASWDVIDAFNASWQEYQRQHKPN